MMNLKSPKSWIIASFVLFLLAEHVVIGCPPSGGGGDDIPGGGEPVGVAPQQPGLGNGETSVKKRSLPNIPASDVEGYFLQTDKNNDGSVDAEEWLRAPFKTAIEDFVKFAEKHDLDKDGAISLDELKAVKEIFE